MHILLSLGYAHTERSELLATRLCVILYLLTFVVCAFKESKHAAIVHHLRVACAIGNGAKA
jgi:hypothetical protein